MENKTHIGEDSSEKELELENKNSDIVHHIICAVCGIVLIMGIYAPYKYCDTVQLNISAKRYCTQTVTVVRYAISGVKLPPLVRKILVSH